MLRHSLHYQLRLQSLRYSSLLNGFISFHPRRGAKAPNKTAFWTKNEAKSLPFKIRGAKKFTQGLRTNAAEVAFGETNFCEWFLFEPFQDGQCFFSKGLFLINTCSGQILLYWVVVSQSRAISEWSAFQFWRVGERMDHIQCLSFFTNFAAITNCWNPGCYWFFLPHFSSNKNLHLQFAQCLHKAQEPKMCVKNKNSWDHWSHDLILIEKQRHMTQLLSPKLIIHVGNFRTSASAYPAPAVAMPSKHLTWHHISCVCVCVRMNFSAIYRLVPCLWIGASQSINWPEMPQQDRFVWMTPFDSCKNHGWDGETELSSHAPPRPQTARLRHVRHIETPRSAKHEAKRLCKIWPLRQKIAVAIWPSAAERYILRYFKCNLRHLLTWLYIEESTLKHRVPAQPLHPACSNCHPAKRRALTTQRARKTQYDFGGKFHPHLQRLGNTKGRSSCWR